MVFPFFYSTIITFSISEAGWSSWGQQQSAQPPPVATPIVTSPPATSPTRAPSSTPSIAASEPPNGTLKKVIATLGHLTKISEFLTEISAYVTGTLTRRHFFIKSAFQFENTLNFFQAVGKDLNRYSTYIKVGVEDYIIGNVSKKVDKKLYQVEDQARFSRPLIAPNYS